jgi:hypothetical protein
MNWRNSGILTILRDPRNESENFQWADASNGSMGINGNV